MILNVWHGTNQSFETFDPERLGMNNPNEASRAAFFFSGNPNTAWDYAEQAARHMIPGQIAHEALVADLMKQAEAASRSRRFDDYERLIAEAEEIEFAALQAEPAGSSLLLCRLDVENPLEVSGDDHAIFLDLGAVLRKAQADGHDCVIIRNIHDTPTGTTGPDDHFAIFDSGKINIVERYPSLDAAMDRENSPSI